MRAVAPTTPRNNGAAIALRRLTAWWRRTLDDISKIVAELGCDGIVVGLTINPYGSGDEPRLVDIDFDGIAEPTRGTPPAQVPPWTYTTRQLDPHASSNSVILPATQSLLRHFSFRHLEATLSSISASLQAVEGQ